MGHLALVGEIQEQGVETLALEGPGIYLRSFKTNLGVSLTPVNFRIDNSDSETGQIFTEMSFLWSPFNLTEVSRLGLVGIVETHYSSEFFIDFKIGAEFVFSSTYMFNGNRLFPVFDIIDLGVDYSITRRTVSYHIAVDLLMVGYAVLISLQDKAQEKNDQFKPGIP
ncbi:MAG: hypothetical protein KAQ93_10020 [Spirochaetales bacterium]|nr:hypothetical protein [Spirochaetales bacterium]